MDSKPKVGRREPATTSDMPNRIGFEGFDVTIQQVVGRIEYDPKSNLSAHEAAYLAVAQYDTEGVYQWKNGNHGVKLTVEYTDDTPAPAAQIHNEY